MLWEHKRSLTGSARKNSTLQLSTGLIAALLRSPSKAHALDAVLLPDLSHTASQSRVDGRLTLSPSVKRLRCLGGVQNGPERVLWRTL